MNNVFNAVADQRIFHLHGTVFLGRTDIDKRGEFNKRFFGFIKIKVRPPKICLIAPLLQKILFKIRVHFSIKSDYFLIKIHHDFHQIFKKMRVVLLDRRKQNGFFDDQHG